MQCKVSRGFAYLPITALHTITLGHETLLLSNEGSSLCARHSRSDRVIGRWPIFGSQIIHGITSCSHTAENNAAECVLAIWGGRMLRICTIVSESSRAWDGNGPIDLRSGMAITVSDWIMTIAINEKSLDALILTAHNALWSLKLSGDPPCMVKDHLKLVGQGIKTLLYSACITVISDERVLIASGTVFGEVIVWLSLKLEGQWNTFSRHVLLGHQGSIFGVAISDLISSQARMHRLLASCSDDRTIRIWDISDCDEVVSGLQDDLLTTNTGFGSLNAQNLHVAMAWAHLSRIWGLHFTSFSIDSNTVIDLVSRGEDGVCQFWNLQVAGYERGEKSLAVSLNASVNDRHHSGKNIWSSTTDSRWNMTKVFTGGADGQIVSRHLPKTNGMMTGSIHFTDVVKTTGDPSARALRQYLVFTNGIILTTTNSGHLLQSSGDTPGNWKVAHESRKPGLTTLSTNATTYLTFYCLGVELCVYDIRNNPPSSVVATLPSQVTWLQVVHHEEHSAQTYTTHLVTNLSREQGSTLIVVDKNNTGFHLEVLQLLLPTGFGVSSSLYCQQHDVLICGSRAGALTIIPRVRSTSEALVEGFVIQNVHGSDSVTSIMILPEQKQASPNNVLHLLTTGRDGTFVVLQACIDRNHIICTTIHRTTLPFGPYVEGAFIITHGNEKPRLILYGFRSKDFIVWDETNQLRLLSVDCGGAHRSWGFSNSIDEPVLFCWTRAGSFNFHRTSQPFAESLQPGSHGREIKTITVMPASNSRSIPQPDDQAFRLLATGAEDTEIRLSKYTTTSLISIAVLKQHVTGLQALQFSPCGNYLFSSGGIEEFYVWKLNKIPLLDVGVVLVGKLERYNEDDDARIMSFSAVPEKSEDLESSVFIILMALSNGKAKVFEFRHSHSADSGNFRLLQVLNIGTLCLTQAHLLDDEKSLSMLIGSTDGFLRFAEMDVAKEAVISHRVHQSSVTAMAVQKLQTQNYLIATGGDDNGLGISLLCTDGASPTFETILIPKAHAAALTAIAFVQSGCQKGDDTSFVVSVGNDQQVRLWCVSGIKRNCTPTINDSRDFGSALSLSTIDVRELRRYPVDVADVSSMEVIERGACDGIYRFEVLVAGVGIQSIQVEMVF